MADPRFFTRSGPYRLSEIAERLGVAFAPEPFGGRVLSDVAALEGAGPSDLSFFADQRYGEVLAKTQAGACVVPGALKEKVPPETAVLIADNPTATFVKAVALFYGPGQGVAFPVAGGPAIDPTAKLGPGVVLGHGTVIAAHAEIGANTRLGPHCFVGHGVCIGTSCELGASVSVSFAYIGDRVVLHPGARIGQEGFGFTPGPQGYLKMPQLGRVIIQDDVEIGANSTVDRGALGDTVIGQGTKIDNLVQIGHNVRIGRGCLIAAQVGISGSAVLGDFVGLGGQVGLADHVRIGARAQLAAKSGAMRDVPAGAVYCGSPARPMKEFMREVATLTRLAKEKRQRHE